MSKLPFSVIVASSNCVDRIEGTVAPWLPLAEEVIVVDQLSQDGTADLAEKLGCRVIRREAPKGNFDLNRKHGLEQAKSEWLLYIDTDERPTAELLLELRDFFSKQAGSFTGMKIPNQFYFLGKALTRGIYNPRSAEIRLFKKGHWDYPCEEGFHRGITVRGEVGRFRSAYKHFNVNTLSEWFIKTNQYTEFDAIHIANEGLWKTIPTCSAFFDGMRFFSRQYFWKLGFLDGYRGLLSVFYFMLYHLTLKAKVWEKTELSKLKREVDYLEPIKKR